MARESPHRPRFLILRCWLFPPCGRRRPQGRDCSPLKGDRELSLVRRETGLFHPTVLGPAGRAAPLRKERAAGAAGVPLRRAARGVATRRGARLNASKPEAPPNGHAGSGRLRREDHAMGSAGVRRKRARPVQPSVRPQPHTLTARPLGPVRVRRAFFRAADRPAGARRRAAAAAAAERPGPENAIGQVPVGSNPCPVDRSAV